MSCSFFVNNSAALSSLSRKFRWERIRKKDLVKRAATFTLCSADIGRLQIISSKGFELFFSRRVASAAWPSEFSVYFWKGSKLILPIRTSSFHSKLFRAGSWVLRWQNLRTSNRYNSFLSSFRKYICNSDAAEEPGPVWPTNNAFISFINLGNTPSSARHWGRSKINLTNDVRIDLRYAAAHNRLNTSCSVSSQGSTIVCKALRKLMRIWSSEVDTEEKSTSHEATSPMRSQHKTAKGQFSSSSLGRLCKAWLISLMPGCSLMVLLCNKSFSKTPWQSCSSRRKTRWTNGPTNWINEFSRLEQILDRIELRTGLSGFESIHRP